MALQYLIPAALEAGGTLANYFLRDEPEEFRNTEAGRRMMQVGRQGRYSPTARRGLVGNVARQTGQSAANQKAAIRGRLSRQGLGNSIAGESLLARPGLARQGLLANYTERLDTRNELSKQQARDQFAVGQTRSKEQQRQEGNAARAGLIQGLTGAASKGYQGYQLGQVADQEPLLAQATAAGLPVSPYSMRYLLQGQGGDDGMLTPEELELIKSKPELFVDDPEPSEWAIPNRLRSLWGGR